MYLLVSWKHNIIKKNILITRCIKQFLLPTVNKTLLLYLRHRPNIKTTLGRFLAFAERLAGPTECPLWHFEYYYKFMITFTSAVTNLIKISLSSDNEFSNFSFPLEHWPNMLWNPCLTIWQRVLLFLLFATTCTGYSSNVTCNST